MGRQIILAPRNDQPPRWALVLLALIIIAGVVVLFRWLEQRDPERRVVGVPAEFMRPPREEKPPREEELPLVVDLELLLSTADKKRLIGRQVALEDAPVQSVVGNFTFWVGPDAERRVPVVLLGELMDRQPETRVEVRENQRVRVFGVVRELRDVDEIEEARFLSPREREALRQSDIFISAQRVVTLER